MPRTEQIKDHRCSVQIGVGFFTGVILDTGPSFHDDIPLLIRGRWEDSEEVTELVAWFERDNAEFLD